MARLRCFIMKYQRLPSGFIIRPWKPITIKLTKQFTCSVRPLSLFYSDASADEVEEIARSALSLARSAQAERDNESCFFVRAAGVHPFIRRYHVNKSTVIELMQNSFIHTFMGAYSHMNGRT
ncbi:hypothetical protein EVAR_44368_1 [Eumeta japonica]|uniref:Uncharacterized protein n=1 Tax=Eumeta variegata TaxID=151549 RepID=A0A4C1X5S5_EUMVA|nr:hypothetical protein EVAR_44368_1 [Eumeta japonica]